jgi:hypothetical protein
VNVTITGTNFDPANPVHIVNMSGAGVSTSNLVVVNATTITCTFTINAAAAPSARDVTVIVGGQQGALVGGFTVTAPPPPTVNSVAPNSGVSGTAVNVTITGTNFDPANPVHNVNVSGAGVAVSNLVVVNATTLTCTFTINGASPAGARDVTVVVGGQQGVLVGGFTITLPPAPTVTSVTPNSGARGAVVNVTITGTNFDPANPVHQVGVAGAGVTVSNVAAVNSTTITCTFTIAGIAQQTARDITVTIGVQASAPLVGGFTVT